MTYYTGVTPTDKTLLERLYLSSLHQVSCGNSDYYPLTHPLFMGVFYKLVPRLSELAHQALSRSNSNKDVKYLFENLDMIKLKKIAK